MSDGIDRGAKRDCHHRSLVVGEGCRVEECSRGTIHLTLGDVTLRMPSDAFIQVATALHVAANRVESENGWGGATRLLC